MHLSTRKIVYFIFILVLLAFGVFFVGVLDWKVNRDVNFDWHKFFPQISYLMNIGKNPDLCYGPVGEAVYCNVCKRTGMIALVEDWRGSNWICEMPAEDGGKECGYDWGECKRGCENGRCKYFSISKEHDINL